MDYVETLIKHGGINRSDALIINDLAKHAVQEAMNVIESAADRAPKGLQTHCLMLASLALEAHIVSANERAMELIREPVESLNGFLVTITPDGLIETQSVDKVDLTMLQGVVGGHIETVPFFTKFAGRPCAAFCNEEGKLKGLKYNELATEMWRSNTKVTGDVLVGPIAVVCGAKVLANL